MLSDLMSPFLLIDSHNRRFRQTSRPPINYEVTKRRHCETPGLQFDADIIPFRLVGHNRAGVPKTAGEKPEANTASYSRKAPKVYSQGY